MALTQDGALALRLAARRGLAEVWAEAARLCRELAADPRMGVMSPEGALECAANLLAREADRLTATPQPASSDAR